VKEACALAAGWLAFGIWLGWFWRGRVERKKEEGRRRKEEGGRKKLLGGRADMETLTDRRSVSCAPEFVPRNRRAERGGRRFA
jgi:hypothetical protein